jgi:hypothetical protein
MLKFPSTFRGTQFEEHWLSSVVAWMLLLLQVCLPCLWPQYVVIQSELLHGLRTYTAVKLLCLSVSRTPPACRLWCVDNGNKSLYTEIEKKQSEGYRTVLCK